jgi:D-3-phosphoglycerate dehydrogenase
MPRVIVLDNLSPDGLRLLDACGEIDYEVRTGLKGDELRAGLLEFDGAICRSGVKITAEALEGNNRLKVIARAGVGTDNIDTAMATRMGIVVMNTPGGNTISTAEHAITLMLALSRNVHPAYQSLIEGRWDRKQYMGTQVAGKTLGIIGLGRVGQAVATRAVALEMQVVGYDPFLPAARARELGITSCDNFRDLLPQVDYLSVHTPLTDDTRDLIGAEEINVMKPGVRLINCARGGIFNAQALVEGLKSGQIGGVALDVFDSEPCTDIPLFGLPNVLCTPHLGASTEEAQANVAVEAAQLLIDFFTSGVIKSSVNMSPLDPATLDDLGGHLDLAHRLGLLLAQVSEGPPIRCQLKYEGEVANKDCRLLTAAFGAGLLEHALDLDVNIVNASLLLRDRGIEVVEQRSGEIGAYGSLITAEVVSQQRTAIASGTLFANRPRLVRKGESHLECRLEGILMLFNHRDVPGVIGKMGSIFGRHQINIADMSVGRGTSAPGGAAVGVLTLDSQPPAEALSEVLALEPLDRAWIVKLPPAGETPAWLGR